MDSVHRNLSRMQRIMLEQARQFYIRGYFTFDNLIVETWFIKASHNNAYYNAADSQPIV